MTTLLDTGNYTPITTDTNYELGGLVPDNYNNTWIGLPNPAALRDIKKGGLYKPPKKARELYELSSPDVQCNRTIGKCPKGLKCYICDIVIANNTDAGYTTSKLKGKSKTSFTKTGRQCEHVLPILVMALICGLYSTGSNKYIDDYFSRLLMFNKRQSKQKIKSDYEKWQNECWQLSYRWSHTECNMVKNEFPFIDIKIEPGSRTNPIEIVGLDEGGKADNNLTTIFQMLLQSDNSWTNMYRQWYNPVIWNELTDKDGNFRSTDDWIEDKKTKLIDTYLTPLSEKIKEGYDKGYFAYSIGILKDIILSKLGNEKFLDTTSAIVQIFNSTKNIRSGSSISKKKKNKTKKPKKKKKRIQAGKGLKEEIKEKILTKSSSAEELEEDIKASLILLSLNPENKTQKLEGTDITVGEALEIVKNSGNDDKTFNLLIENIVLNYQETLLAENYSPALINDYINNVKRSIKLVTDESKTIADTPGEYVEAINIEGFSLEETDPTYWQYIARETYKNLSNMHSPIRSGSKKKKTKKKKKKTKKKKKKSLFSFLSTF